MWQSLDNISDTYSLDLPCVNTGEGERKGTIRQRHLQHVV